MTNDDMSKDSKDDPSTAFTNMTINGDKPREVPNTTPTILEDLISISTVIGRKIEDAKYTGSILNGQPHGMGMLLKNGTVTIGYWQHGNLNGEAVTIEKGSTGYYGKFKEDKPNGFGFKYDIRAGCGYLECDNTDINKSDTIENNTDIDFDEFKIVKNRNIGNKKYTGCWYDHNPHGVGVIAGNANGPTVIGNYNKHFCNGKATIYYKGNGSYYGDMVNNNRNGLGARFYPDGSKYVGQYKGDKQTGIGAFSDVDGVMYIGNFVDGQYNGKILAVDKDGKTNKDRTGHYEDGQRVKGIGDHEIKFIEQDNRYSQFFKGNDKSIGRS